ncbi:hypothetical protein PENTCL1PPCAC_27260, partial [Pristionchus entomophagus]
RGKGRDPLIQTRGRTQGREGKGPVDLPYPHSPPSTVSFSTTSIHQLRMFSSRAVFSSFDSFLYGPVPSSPQSPFISASLQMDVEETSSFSRFDYMGLSAASASPSPALNAVGWPITGAAGASAAAAAAAPSPSLPSWNETREETAMYDVLSVNQLTSFESIVGSSTTLSEIASLCPMMDLDCSPYSMVSPSLLDYSCLSPMHLIPPISVCQQEELLEMLHEGPLSPSWIEAAIEEYLLPTPSSLETPTLWQVRCQRSHD